MAAEYARIAKITRPTLADPVARQRLFEILDRDVRAQPVTWITGPPGSGKTTLVASYLEARAARSIWYRVDGGDDDIATFFYYLGLAAKKAAPRFRDPLPLFTPEYAAGASTFVRRFFETLTSRFRKPFVLVFDNYQDVPAGSVFHELLSGALSEIPEGFSILILSRDAPPPAFSRPQANGALAMVGWDELKFDLPETLLLIKARMRTIPEDSLVRMLHEKTDGWAAGIVLSILGLKQLRVDATALSGIAPDTFFGYFASEIYDKVDPEVRDFLQRSAFLPEMTDRLARNLTGNGRTEQILIDLSRRNYFTEKRLHDDGQSIYQFHPLFREFLLSRARKVYDPSDLRTLQTRAGGLLAASGRIEDAASLYHLAGCVRELAGMIAEHAQELISQGRHRTLMTWFSWLPEEIVHLDPHLLFWLSLCHLPFDPRKGRNFSEQAYDRFRAENDVTGMFMTCYPAVGAIAYEQADYRQLDRWIDALESVFRTVKTFPSPEIEVRSTNSMFISLLLRKPYHRDIQRYLERYLELSRSMPDANLRIQLEADASLYYLWTGDLVKAIEVIDTLLNFTRRKDAAIAPLPFVLLKTYEAMYHAFLGEHGPCQAAVEKGLEIARTSGVNIMYSQLMTHAVAGALGAGDLGTAANLLDELRVGMQRTQRVIVAYYHYMKAWHAFLAQETDAASRHIKEALEHAEAIGFPFLEAMVRVGMAQVKLEHGAHEEAREHLDRAFGIGRAMKSRILEFMCILSGAHGSLRAGRRKDGLASLRRALAIGKDNGYTFFLFWHPRTIAFLCEEALDAGIEVEYVRQLVRKRALIPAEPLNVSAHWPWPVAVTTLGSFEILSAGKPMRFSRKAQQKPLSLLKAVIAAGGADVALGDLMEALWPDAEADQAHKACEITLLRLRKLLGSDASVLLREGRVRLDPRSCLVDAWSLEHHISRADAAWADAEAAGSGRSGQRATQAAAEAVRLSEKAIRMYAGHFLPADTDHPWVLPYRERLRSKFIRTVLKLGAYLETSAEWDRAIEYYRKGLEVDDLAEQFYRHLMICHRQRGDHAEGLRVYQRCRSALDASLGIEPSALTQDIYRSMKDSPSSGQ